MPQRCGWDIGIGPRGNCRDVGHDFWRFSCFRNIVGSSCSMLIQLFAVHSKSFQDPCVLVLIGYFCWLKQTIQVRLAFSIFVVRYGPRSDVFSLGCSIFEASGILPCETEPPCRIIYPTSKKSKYPVVVWLQSNKQWFSNFCNRAILDIYII